MKQTLCKYLGGSHLYGMNTPASDIDKRGVFMNLDPLYVYGFKRLDNEVKQTAEEDVVMHELTEFLRLAAKSNTQTLECLFAPLDAFNTLDPEFKQWVLDERFRFLHTDQLYKSLRGYLQNEMRLALGERTGELGSKRKNALELHGFSPKNFTHLLRLAECGTQFFKNGVYPVRLIDFNPAMHELCMRIKTTPEQFTAEELKVKALAAEELMVACYQNLRDRNKYVPDFDYIASVLQHFYSTRCK